MTSISGGRFDLTNVLNCTFDVTRKNFGPFTVMALVLVGLPTLLASSGEMALQTGDTAGIIRYFGGLALSMVGAYVLQAALVYMSIKSLNGGTPKVQDGLRIGVRFFLPLLGLAIIAGLATLLGLILLIVPGLILMTMWVVAAPALVIEERGITESLDRSRQLTKGNRWQVFGVIMLYMIAVFIISFVVGAVSTGVGLGFGVAATTVITMAINLIISVVQSVVGAAGVAAIYYELRKTKEGAVPSVVASVFD